VQEKITIPIKSKEIQVRARKYKQNIDHTIVKQENISKIKSKIHMQAYINKSTDPLTLSLGDWRIEPNNNKLNITSNIYSELKQPGQHCLSLAYICV
jgi:hypothetical protein